MTEDQRKREDENNSERIMTELDKNKHKLDPNSDPFKLKEQFEDTLPKFGEPVMARWAFIAFKRSEHQAKARSGVATRQLDEIEEARLEKEVRGVPVNLSQLHYPNSSLRSSSHCRRPKSRGG